MQNSQQPPRYGAEGPPGGVEAWNAQRNAQAQQQGGKKNLMQRMGGAIANMPQFAQNRQPQQAQPQPWGQVPRMQWGQPQGGPPQGMPPQAQGAPPQMPPSGAGAGPQPGMGIMPMQPPQQGAQPPQQAQRQQPDPRMAMLASSPMSGLGMAAARVNALRNRGKVQQ